MSWACWCHTQRKEERPETSGARPYKHGGEDTERDGQMSTEGALGNTDVYSITLTEPSEKTDFTPQSEKTCLVLIKAERQLFLPPPQSTASRQAHGFHVVSGTVDLM